MKVKLKKTSAYAIVPSLPENSAVFDLHAVDIHDYITVCGSIPVTFRTGLIFEIPPGYVMLVFSLPSHGVKNATRLANCIGVIDSNYRGEVLVKLTRDTSRSDKISVRSGDVIAQAMIFPVSCTEFELVDNLSGGDA
jgi:dUTP pyrophosphatase